METKIKDFESAAIEAISALRKELGAKRIDMSIHIDDYEKGCKTDLTFFTSISNDASRPVPECGPGCKGD